MEGELGTRRKKLKDLSKRKGKIRIERNYEKKKNITGNKGDFGSENKLKDEFKSVTITIFFNFFSSNMTSTFFSKPYKSNGNGFRSYP